MDIRIYEESERLPDGHSGKLSSSSLAAYEIENLEGDELKSFLKALLAIDMGIIAHIHIDKKRNIFAGEKVKLVITTKPKDGDKLLVLFGLYDERYTEGGGHFESFSLDVNLEKVLPETRPYWERSKKDFFGWKNYFLEIFTKLRNEKIASIQREQKVLDCLTEGFSADTHFVSNYLQTEI